MERPSDLHLERAGAEALGLVWTAVDEEPSVAPGDVVVVPSSVQVRAGLMERMPGGLVLTTTSGYDHIDLASARRLGVSVGRCPEARRDAVAEWTVGAALDLLYRGPWLQEEARNGRWARSRLADLPRKRLADARVVLVGMGVIGQRVASLLAAFGCEVLPVDPKLADKSRELVAVLPEADVVSLHCNLHSGSLRVLDADKLRLLSPRAIVLNSARGDVLDLAAAMLAVQRGRLGGLAIDVFPTEPFPNLAQLTDLPNVLATPHAAGHAQGLGQRVADEVLRTLQAWVEGRGLPHQVV